MPLSKLFQRNSSVKDKKVSPNSSNTSSSTNEPSTSVKCNLTSEETKKNLSTEDLPHPEETSAFSESEEKVMEQSSSDKNPQTEEKVVQQSSSEENPQTEEKSSLPTNETQIENCEIGGVGQNIDSKEQFLKAEYIPEHTIQCKSGDVSIEEDTTVINEESCIEASLELVNRQVDEVDTSIMKSVKTDTIETNDSGNVLSEVSKLDATSNKTSLPADEDILRGLCDTKNEMSSDDAVAFSERPNQIADGIKSVFRDSKDEVDFKSSAQVENANVKPCDLKESPLGSLTSDEISEKNPISLTLEVTEEKQNQLPENANKQRGEPVQNSELTGSAIRSRTFSEEDNRSSSSTCGDSNCENSEKVEKSPKKKNQRSCSFSESDSKPGLVHSKTRRRKCESESAAVNSVEDEEGLDNVAMELQKKDLKEVIEKCVDKLLRESIAVAVKNVNVEGLCDEVMKTMSERSQSDSSSSSGEQKLHSNCIKDCADLVDSFEDSVEASEEDNDKDENIGDEMLRNEIDVEKISSSEILPKESVVGKEAESEELKVMTRNDLPDRDVPGNATESNEEKDLDGDRAYLEESSSIQSLVKEIIDGDYNEDVNTTESLTQDDVNASTQGDTHSEIKDITALASKEDETPKSDSPGDPNSAEVSEMRKDSNSAEVSEMRKDSNSAEVSEMRKDSNSAEVSETRKQSVGMLRVESEDLLSMMDDADPLSISDNPTEVAEELPSDLEVKVPQLDQQQSEEGKKANWKVGYLQVKMPPKSRGKGHLKAWKKRCVAIHPDEFANDPKDPWLMISVYSGSGRHTASFWKSVSSRKAVVYRSSSSSQRYAFTIADDNKPLLHLAAESEAQAQEWMAAVRTVLWPPSPVVQLEKMLNGSQFEVSLIDNDFSYRAGLLGMYGHLTITPTKLILVHPQQGYVIQEWYLNTVDKFELMHQPKIEDVHKVLCMTTCSDSSTGQGEILIFCREAVSLLQSLASTIHQILTHHSKQDGGSSRYAKELEEMAGWLAPAAEAQEDYYKVPPRQVRSLLDIPNFIFNKPLGPAASTANTSTTLDPIQNPPLTEVPSTTRGSQDSGISAGATSTDDFLNCSTTSFMVGTGKSSDSDELSDTYIPPRSPAAKVRNSKRSQEALKKDVN